MEQFDREDTEALTTPTPAPTYAPNPSVPTTTPLTPTPAPKKKSNKLKIILIVLLAIIFLGLIGYATYAVLTINSLNDRVGSLNKNYSTLKADNKKLTADNKELRAEVEETTAADDEDMTASETIDTNFVALAPAADLVSADGKTVFSWGAHKEATKYVVEIRSANQTVYPTAYVVDQTITVDATNSAASTLSLTKTLASGSYVWRVTALHTMSGQDMVLQSTTDRTYQVK